MGLASWEGSDFRTLHDLKRVVGFRHASLP
jgi:hypothetical protein